eukprot:scaffold5312_cov71-Cyclotella_meneghiniana.AAC.8
MKKSILAMLLICSPIGQAFQSTPSLAASCRGSRNLSRFVSTESRIDVDVVDPFTSHEPSPEHALLLPGHTVRIQIGDVTASRKAWKKRRRNSSPILVPCSILGMNREWMVRWNIMTLLYMIGEESSSACGATSATCSKIGKAYRKRLGGDLGVHAEALGHDSVESLIQSLFDERIQAEYGIQTFIEPQHGNLMLTTSLTRRQARTMSRSAAVIQFRSDIEDAETDNMIHTGMAKIVHPTTDGKVRITHEPLGAAIRVPPDDKAVEFYESGDEFSAFVHSYDLGGDHESPLLVLTLDDPRGKNIAGTMGVSIRVAKRKNVKTATFNDASIERKLVDLSVGDGPIQATVVAVSPHSNSVFVDCGVGRTKGKKFGGGMAKVLGMLRFDDMQMNESEVAAGDTVEVYIKAVFNQSGRFMVSMDPSVKTNKPKDLKQEKEADKRIERLSSKFNKDDIDALVGKECDGVVKAKSQTGDWYYVQPHMDGEDGVCLPVGLAGFVEGESEENRVEYTAGDTVRVRLEGIDDKRGQLSMTLVVSSQ